MTFQEIREEIQFWLRETSGSEIFWSQSELNSYINEAQFDIVRKTECLWNTIVYVLGYGDYMFALPDDVYEIPKMRVIHDEDKHLTFITINQLIEEDEDYENAAPGTPKYWYYTDTDTLYIYPPVTTTLDTRTYTFSAETGRIVRATSSDKTYTFSAETGKIVKIGSMLFSAEKGRVVRIQPTVSDKNEKYYFTDSQGKVVRISDSENAYNFSSTQGKIIRIQDDNSGGDQYLFNRNPGIVKKIESPIDNLKVHYIKQPKTLSADADSFEIHDIFKYAMIKYVLYKVWEEKKEFQNLELSAVNFKEYLDELERIMPVAKSKARSRQARITAPDLR